MQFPIIIGLHRSFLFDAALGLTAALASAMALVYSGPMPMRISLLLLVWMVAALAWRKMAPIGLRLRMERDGRLSIERDAQNGFMPASLLAGAVVHPWLTVARLRDDGGQTIALVVVRDSLEADDFRRLRMFLRWRAKINGAESA